MKTGKKLFICTDYPINGGMPHTDEAMSDYNDVVAHLGQMAKERFYVGGIIPATGGAMTIFEAESMEEAEKVARMKDCPFVNKGYYRRELCEWNIVISSEDDK